MKGYQQFIPIFFIASLLGFNPGAAAQVWQWSVTVDSVVSGETKDHPMAFLWIPENCKQVRGVVVGRRCFFCCSGFRSSARGSTPYAMSL